MEKFFKNVLSAFLTPVNYLLYIVILLYFIGYITGNADDSGYKLFLFVCVVGNVVSALFLTMFDRNNVKKFDNFYIYGKSKKGRD